MTLRAENLPALNIPAAYIRRLIQRGVMFWVLAHMMLAMMLALGAKLLRDIGAAAVNAFAVSPGSILYVALIVGILSWVEVDIRRERIFIANLGIAPLLFAAIPAVTAAVLDCILGIAQAVL